MRFALLPIDQPNKNGRIYTRKAVEHALANLPSWIPLKSNWSNLHPGMTEDWDTLNLVGQIQHLEIEKSGTHIIRGPDIDAEYKLVGTAVFNVNSEDGKKLIEKNCAIRPSGFGTLNTDVEPNIVGEDYRICGFFFTNDPA